MANLKELKVKRKPYFYDSQIKRYLLQIMSVFAGYQIRTGKQRDGEHRYINIPVVYASYSRVVGYLLSGGNNNSVLPLPIMSVEIEGIKQSGELRRNPQHYEKIYVRVKDDSEEKFKLMTVERYMAIPYELTVSVSLWASNEDSIMQVIEQIGVVFNSGLDIQLSNSPLDWTFLSTMEFNGDFRKKRVGTDLGGGTGDDDYYVVDMEFTVPIHLSPPVKYGEGKRIETVHVNILEMNDPIDFDTMENIENFVIRAED